jgi:cytochrome c oxidase subunit III
MSAQIETHGHSLGQHPALQHQFDNMSQQQESATIGMWMFLAQEIMFFGGAFTVYLVFRSKFPTAFAAGSNHLDMWWGLLNTIVLIVSSLTMALAVRAAQKSNRNQQVVFIILTMILGATFLMVKAIEYTDKYNHGLVPVSGLNRRAYPSENHSPTQHKEEPKGETKSEGHSAIDSPKFEKVATAEGGNEHQYENPNGVFQWNQDDTNLLSHATNYEKKIYYKADGSFNKEAYAGKVQIFYLIYFAMTGLHALHMIIGLGIMSWLLWMAWRGAFTAEYYTPVEISGLYWHFVDIVWIFLFPLLYLLGRHFGGH